MFYSCNYSLDTVKFSNIDRPPGQPGDWFRWHKDSWQEYCDNVTQFDTVGDDPVILPEDCTNLFCACSKIKDFSNLRKFDASRVESFYNAFNGISPEVKELDLTCWRVTNITSTACMFEYAKNLEVIDFSSWDFSKVSNCNNMFYECTDLREIKVYKDQDWRTPSSSSGSNMFSGCEKLPNWEEDKLDIAQAYLGEGGYFTLGEPHYWWLPYKLYSRVDRYLWRSEPYYSAGYTWYWIDILRKEL